jgi:hypothetical protein
MEMSEARRHLLAFFWRRFAIATVEVWCDEPSRTLTGTSFRDRK